MTNISSTHQRGYILEVPFIPAGFLTFLQKREYIGEASPTTEGVYLEPRSSLAHILALFEKAGVPAHSFRASGTRARWQESNLHRGFKVLSNPRSSSWLPTAPAA